MDCTDIKNRLDDWLDGELTEAQAAALEAHADDCPACRVRLDQARDLRERLRCLPAPEPDAGFFDRALAEAIEQNTRRRHWRWFGVGGALAATLVLAIGLGSSLLQDAPAPVLQEAAIGIGIADHPQSNADPEGGALPDQAGDSSEPTPETRDIGRELHEDIR